MAIIYKVSRLWTVILPTVLLAATFQYAHQLNAIINSIGDMGFKKDRNHNGYILSCHLVASLSRRHLFCQNSEMGLAWYNNQDRKTKHSAQQRARAAHKKQY